MSEWENISALVGKTLTNVRRLPTDEDALYFEADDGSEWQMYHSQDCCESVSIEDINGDLSDLIGAPILKAEEVTNSDLPAKYDYAESYTWTFYKLATIKGSVDIRWYGSSNGYYSERVDFVQIRPATPTPSTAKGGGE